MVGEAWTVLAGKGSAFQDQNNPQPVFRVGTSGSQGIMEITDFVFTTIGPSKLFIPGFSLVPYDILQLLAQSSWNGTLNSHQQSKQVQACGILTSGNVFINYYELTAKFNGITVYLHLGSAEVSQSVYCRLICDVYFLSYYFRCWDEPRCLRVPIKWYGRIHFLFCRFPGHPSDLSIYGLPRGKLGSVLQYLI